MNPSDPVGLSDHPEARSTHGDALEVLKAIVDVEYFRGWLVEGLGNGDGSKGGRPPFDPVLMLQAPILLNSTSHFSRTDTRIDTHKTMRLCGYRRSAMSGKMP